MAKKKRRVYEAPPKEDWKPTKAYNFQGLRSHVDLSMPNGQKQAFGPATWYVPITEEEDLLLEHEFEKQNPPHLTVRTCEVDWDEDRGLWVAVVPNTTED